MQNAIEFLTVVGGLVFSVSCALLVEELIFGGLFKLFFHHQAATMQVERVQTQSRKQR